MKNTSLLQFSLLAAVLGLLTGCAAVTRTATDAGLGAGGAALGAELSHNNPYAIIGGAAGGALLGETLHFANGKLNEYANHKDVNALLLNQTVQKLKNGQRLLQNFD